MNLNEFLKLEKPLLKAINDAEGVIKKNQEILDYLKGNVEHPPLNQRREAQAKDIVIGANIWQYTSDDDGDKWYLQRVVEVLKPSDQFKAYIAEDGCRYGLDDAWIEIFIKDI